MNSIYIPTQGPVDWQKLLAEPERHWKQGYSAHALATCWECAKGIPPEIAKLFLPHFDKVELLLGIPEFKVALPGGRRESQNDLFCLLRADGNLMVLMVEGKVEEPFDSTLAEWLRDASDGKRERLAFVTQLLGLNSISPSIRYQLLHRTASAVLTARRFGSSRAAMIVHSFSEGRSWLADFQAFTQLYGAATDHDQMVKVDLPDQMELYLGWASGISNPK